MKKRKVGLYDIGSLPLTPVKREPGYVGSLREYRLQYDREQQEIAARKKAEAEKPIRELEREFSRNFVALRTSQAEALFIIPSEELKTICQLAPETVEGTAEQIGTQIRNAFETLGRELASEGITLHASGLDKLKSVALLNTALDIRLVSVWRKIYEHMTDLGVFTADDVTVPQPAKTRQPVNPYAERVPDLAELERLDLSTREGSARGKELANEHYYSVEAAAVYQRWTSWLYETFKYVLTEDAKKAAIQWFQVNNQSYLSPKAWEQARRSLVKRGLMPRTCLTPEEIVGEQWENRSERSDDYHARRQLATDLQHFGEKLLG